MASSPEDIPPDAMLRRMRALRRRLVMGDDELLETYWRFHPRFRFVKTVPHDALVLDVGAGSGGLAQWKSWLAPSRDDVAFHGADQARGAGAALYRSWEILDLDREVPSFPGVTFDAFVLSHVIEHLRDPARTIGWIASRIRPGGRVYIEWPGENAARQPRREAFLRQGIDIVITNFFDDATHLRMLPRTEVVTALHQSGLTVLESGTIDHGVIGEEMLARGLTSGDSFAKLAGYWSISRWSDWIVAESRPGV